MRLRAALFAAALAAGCAPSAGPADAQVWQENATRLMRDFDKDLAWGNPMGDWVDRDGKPLGASAFGRSDPVTAKAKDIVKIEIDVTDLVRRHGADFRINSVGGFAVLNSREAAEGQPRLEVTSGAGKRSLAAVADTELNVSTQKPLGDRELLTTRYGVLMRFDQPADPAITRATLVVTSFKRYGKKPTQLLVFRPVALDKAVTVTPGATYQADRPQELRTNPKVTAALGAGMPESAHRGRPAQTILAVKGSDLKPRVNSRIDGDVYTGWFEGSQKTASGQVLRLPGARTEAYLTVVIKLWDDWQATGGKLPGLSNTGLGDRQNDSGCTVGDKEVGRGGWGGRPANGCRWSARTTFQRNAAGNYGAGTYFYAVKPSNVNGVVEYWTKPIPKGRWFAYVQYVRLNEPSKADGEVAYWLVDRQLAPGGAAVQSAGGIVFRTIGDPRSAINEVWADVYCGGKNCGPIPWPRYTMSLKRLTVTDALPDLTALQAEVDRLNASER